MKKIGFYLITLSCFLAFNSAAYLSSAAFAAGIPIIPGGQGFGMDTPAGSGRSENTVNTTVRKVTNTNNSGGGSFRQAILNHNSSGKPSVIVFETSGTIRLTSKVSIKGPNLTVAGQTAPSPGITLRGHTLEVYNTRDVLIQHIRVRLGDEINDDLDGILVYNSSNIVLDHVSTSWGVDETLDIATYGSYDVTARLCIVSEGLKNSVHSQGDHSKGMFVVEAWNVSMLYNLMAHNDSRNPFYGRTGNGHDLTAVTANNVIYNWESRAVYITDQGSGSLQKLASIIGNVFISGIDRDKKPIWIDDNTITKVYLYNNMLDGVVPGNPWGATLVDGNSPLNTKVSSAPIKIPGFTAMPVSQVKDYVLANAGARPADRDAVDNRIVRDVIDGTGRIIDSQYDVGGWPLLAKNYRVLSIPGNPHGDNDGDGYTNLEEWLHAFAAEVEGGGSIPPPAPQANVPDPPTNLRIIN